MFFIDRAVSVCVLDGNRRWCYCICCSLWGNLGVQMQRKWALIFEWLKERRNLAINLEAGMLFGAKSSLYLRCIPRAVLWSACLESEWEPRRGMRSSAGAENTAQLLCVSLKTSSESFWGMTLLIKIKTIASSWGWGLFRDHIVITFQTTGNRISRNRITCWFWLPWLSKINLDTLKNEFGLVVWADCW